jgi:predicted nucleotidyltransferase
LALSPGKAKKQLPPLRTLCLCGETDKRQRTTNHEQQPVKTDFESGLALLSYPWRRAIKNIMKEKEIFSEIQNIVGQIIEKYKPSKIILFGSAGRGEYDKVNDLDFLIIKQDVPLYGLERMRQLDRLIERNIACDLLVYRPDEFEERIKLGDPFIESVLREGQVLYG